uniref:Putative secreted protein n=1 Tax=Anopheles marajoara TaxID=58244 RepID=A0A2M4CCL7_9DIPT
MLRATFCATMLLAAPPVGPPPAGPPAVAPPGPCGCGAWWADGGGVTGELQISTLVVSCCSFERQDRDPCCCCCCCN